MQSLELMKTSDNFAKTQDIPSELKYGSVDGYPVPMISIMIPTYQRPAFLKIALESALQQTKPTCRYEVVVIDNEYSDGVSETEALIRQYQDDRLLYYQNKQNLGLVGNWNRCITLARGEWVAYLHDDDVLMPDYLNKILQLLSKKRDIDGIMTLYHELHQGENADSQLPRAKSVKSGLYDRLSRNKLMPLRQVDSVMKIGNVYGPPTCGSIFRRACLVSSGGFNDTLYPSFDWFYLYAYSKRFRLYRSMERLAYYRVFVNVSLKDETKAAFLRHRIQFREDVARDTRVGAFLKRFFVNEQNQALLKEEYTDHVGKIATDYFNPNELKKRRIRATLYHLLTTGYWRLKSLAHLVMP